MDTVLLITDLNSGSRLPILRGARLCAAAYDAQVQIVELARIQVPIAKMLAFWKPVGCIVEGSSHITITRQLTNRLPIVHIDANAGLLATNPPFTVINDNAAIAELAVKSLLQAGCEHFAFVGWTRDVNWSTLRLDSFKSTLASLGKTCQSLLDPWTMGNAADFSTRLRPWLKQLPRPCGIFAANDDIASVILDSCRTAGLSVPDEIAVIGVDDVPEICDALKPSLSSIRPDFQRGGYLAADLLFRRLANPALPSEHLTFAPLTVTLRQSTRRLPLTPPKIRTALELIRRQATSGLKAADVVKQLGMSERLAETRFKTAVGHRITEEITEVRLAHVLELLSDPRQSITPIANLCGWESEVYLKRLFKAHFGMTMREWRARHAGKDGR